MPLEQELETFRRELPNLLKEESNRGKFVLIHGNDVVGVWSTREEALPVGYNRFGVDTFLVKEVTEQERPRYFSRKIPR